MYGSTPSFSARAKGPPPPIRRRANPRAGIHPAAMSSPENPSNGGTSAAAPSEPAPPAKPAAKGKKDDDLSEEDLALKEQLELYVVRAQDVDLGVQRLALESMRQEIRSATSSMTSVPKPLTFLRPHYGTLKSYYESMPDSELKSMADILSVLALTMSAEVERESLRYRLLGSEGDIASWGHEYMRAAGQAGVRLPLFCQVHDPITCHRKILSGSNSQRSRTRYYRRY